MNDSERLQLKNMIRQSECEDNTEYIRKLKHSTLIREDVLKMEQLKKKNLRMRKNDPEKFSNLCQKECSFLYSKYTDIYHKVYKDELNLDIMSKLLDCLKKIEDGDVDQHEGSVLFGKIAADMYIDAGLRGGKNVEAAIEPEPEKVYAEAKPVSWKDYKRMNQ
jgi:hypothetical protein